jgi:competence protein ComEA
MMARAGVALATARFPHGCEPGPVNDVVVPAGPKARLEELVGRRIDTGVLIAAVAILVVGGLLVWGRRPAAAIAPPATAPPSPAAATPAGAGVFVHVAGAVRRPGLYELPGGGRVADALAAAGGAVPRADLDLLNLAAPLADGMKIDVPARGGSAPPAAAGTVAPAAGTGAPPAVSLNSAGAVELETIPGVGPVTAAAILAYRDEAGPFTSVEQLMEVSGIGPATLESIRPYVTL